MPTVNIGILAHVDAGKTSLTERLLYDTGVLARLGRVDAGTTRTDSTAVERRRGITIRSAMAALPVPYGQVNLIDTPGHSEFVAEVERALDVLDGAVLVVSAVEGVQPQTRVLMRTLRRLGLPTLIFVNKIDRTGARYGGLLDDIARRLSPDAVAMTGLTDAGSPAARAPLHDPASTGRLAEVLADHDEDLLSRLVDGPAPNPAELATALTAQTRAGRVHPVYFGSAITGTGVPELLDAVTRFVPAAAGAPGGPAGTFFAVRRGPADEKVGYLRLFAGELRRRDRVRFWRHGTDGVAEGRGRVTDLRVVAPDRSPAVLRPGDIAEIRGPADIRAGDRIGAGGRAAGFAPPGLKTVVRARDEADVARLHAAIRVLVDCDPLVVVTGIEDGGVGVRLYGEVQKEIIAATLAEEFGVDVVFEPSRAVYLERPAGTGEAVEEIGEREPVGFWATIGLRVRPGPYGSGVRFGRDTELGALPRAFDRAIEATVRDVLGHGLYGWPVTDCAVTLTRSGYASPLSVAGDFRGRTPRVLRRALAEAGTRVYEPVHAFDLEVPGDTVGAVAARLAALDGVLDGCAEIPADPGTFRLTGALPARHVHTVRSELPGLSRGDGAWWSRPEGDRPVTGAPPRRTPR